MLDDQGTSGAPSSATAPQEEQATSRSAVRLFSGRAISQLRINLSRAANAPLFGLHKQASTPCSLTARFANGNVTAATLGKQSPEQPSVRAATSTPIALLTATCSPPGAALEKAPELEALPRRLEHSLSNLEVLRTLGTGTFGRVRLVRCRLTGRFLALKALKKAEILRMRQEHSVHKEKQILASLQHPFIVRMLTVFADKERLYLLMEYVPGGELFKRLREVPGHRLVLAEARFYAAGVALALEYLHSSGVIYRDLKPENLLLDSTGYIKLTDFGFARELDAHCRSFTLCGTTEYMAPEMVRGTGYGMGADWWSFGVLVFEMLCGYPPFLGPTAVYARIVAGAFTCPDHVDPHAQDLIRRLLTAAPSARLGSLPGGARDIFVHPFFAGFPWEDLLQGRLQAPFVPALSAPGDARHFNMYTESVDEGDGGAVLPGASATLCDEAFRDFAVTRLITEDALRHFQHMSQVNG